MYGRAHWSPTKNNNNPKLPHSGILWVQQIIDSLIYYILAVNCTILVILGDLVSIQTQASTETWDAIVWLLNYSDTHPDAEVTYVVNDICLHTHSATLYVSAPKSRSWAGGAFFFGDKSKQGKFPGGNQKQWSYPCCIKNNQKRSGVCSWREIWAGYINARELLHISVQWINRLSSMPYAHPSGKPNCCWFYKQNHWTKKVKNCWHDFY